MNLDPSRTSPERSRPTLPPLVHHYLQKLLANTLPAADGKEAKLAISDPDTSCAGALYARTPADGISLVHAYKFPMQVQVYWEGDPDHPEAQSWDGNSVTISRGRAFVYSDGSFESDIQTLASDGNQPAGVLSDPDFPNLAQLGASSDVEGVERNAEEATNSGAGSSFAEQSLISMICRLGEATNHISFEDYAQANQASSAFEQPADGIVTPL